MPLFLSQSKSSKSFTITNLEMTRFNITLDQGVEFVCKCFERMLGGEIFVPKIPSFRVHDLAKAINDKKEIKIIGIRPGEKIHEEMITATDLVNTLEFGDYFLIFPQFKFGNWSQSKYLNHNKIKSYKKVKSGFIYSSDRNEKFLNIPEIKSIIKKIIND